LKLNWFQENPEWDWFGYDWIAEYGGFLQTDNGETVGRVFWLDYNNLVTIALISVPVGNYHYMRLKGFGVGYKWTGHLYRDDTPFNSIPMNWIFIPLGDVAWSEFSYIDLFGQPWHVSGWLRLRWHS
jgi:hypothetical protein